MTTETLVTDGTTTETAASQTAEPAAATLLDAPQQQQETTTVETKPADAATSATTVPDAYEFAVPEGHELTDDIKAELTATAKERGMTQEAAQQMLNDRAAWADKFKAVQTDAMTKARTEWESASKQDKEFGGDKLAENLGVARKALDQFATPELRSLLNQSGLGNHPEVIRLLVRAGKAISEDRIVTGGSEPVARDAAPQAIYSKSQMNP